MDSNDVPLKTRGDPWFADGNIILVPKSENQVAFKVHRGVLSRHSEVFRSMFDIPQPGIVVAGTQSLELKQLRDQPLRAERPGKAVR
jgi:hypothetical protein